MIPKLEGGNLMTKKKNAGNGQDRERNFDVPKKMPVFWALEKDPKIAWALRNGYGNI